MRVGNYEIGLFYARKAENRSMSLSNPATAAYFGLSSYAGGNITDSRVLSVPPAWAAIRYISEGIASAGCGVFQRQTDGDVFPDYTDPVSYLINGRPHPNYTMFDFLQALVSNACMGNGYARIYFDATTARPYALELIPQEYVCIEYGQRGELFYRVTGTINNKSVNVVLPETEMIHVKGVTFTGVMGKRVSLVHKGSFETGLSAQTYSNAYFEKGASVGGLITFPNLLTPQQRNDLREKVGQNHAGANNAGSVMVLDGGADFKAMQANPKDAAVIDFRNLSTIEVSQIFKVPLHLLSQLDRSTFSNMEQQNQDFVTHCLTPWSSKIAQEFTTKLFTTAQVRNRRKFFAFDLSALMQGDMQAQAAFYASAIQNGWMTPNEVRAKRNLNKVEGGDTLFIQQNMAPMDMLGEILEGKMPQEKEDTGGGESETDTNESESDATGASAD